MRETRERPWGEERESRSDCGACRPPSHKRSYTHSLALGGQNSHACSSILVTEDWKWNTVNIRIRDVSSMSPWETLLSSVPLKPSFVTGTVLSTLLHHPLKEIKNLAHINIPPFTLPHDLSQLLPFGLNAPLPAIAAANKRARVADKLLLPNAHFPLHRCSCAMTCSSSPKHIYQFKSEVPSVMVTPLWKFAWSYCPPHPSPLFTQMAELGGRRRRRRGGCK